MQIVTLILCLHDGHTSQGHFQSYICHRISKVIDSINGVIEDLVEVDGGYISFLRPVFREVNPFVADSALNDFLRTVIEVSRRALSSIRQAQDKSHYEHSLVLRYNRRSKTLPVCFCSVAQTMSPVAKASFLPKRMR